ncbi:MAG: 16S rRNA (adenine(1518)-N(6)/adenine(1519)-N(6))-dimethyltransferase RsmA [Cardiobacteriaceae bacterium]|nr:16S rRNA (adenine(1518)-N(6)/adenine(1519)-N(6))-dimethyltransferase RsmA [Cardiobacteriaceae bacterium]
MNEVKADKRLGQHFLHDENVITRLMAVIAPKHGDAILEIGPGLGALTLPVLRQSGALTAVEFDTRVLAPLAKKATGIGSLHLIHADILDMNFAQLAAEQGREDIHWRLIGNLPYNLSSPILFHCLAQRHVIQDMHFMLQKEVVERIVAGPGSKTYGRLSIMAQLYCEASALFDIPPDAFTPAPRVDSAIVRLIPRTSLAWQIDDLDTFADTVRLAFAQRRKMLRHTFGKWFDSAALAAIDIEPTARAETLDGAAFARLANIRYRQEHHI